MNENQKLPDFLIIGAPKCGTTSLYQYLDQHPEVFFPEYKEPNYFALAGEKLPKLGPVEPDVMHALIYSRSITDFDHYQSIFQSAGDEKKLGEASVRYLYFEKSAQRIKDTIPEVKMIAILREPVSRLYSHYCMNKQYQLEPLDLMEALEKEDERVAAGWGWDWHYRRIGMYAEQLKRYFDLFGREQVKVFLHDDFVKGASSLFQETCRHIGIEDSFEPDMSKRGKVAYRPNHLGLDRWLHWPSPSRRVVQKLFPAGVTGPVFAKLRELNGQEVPKLDPVLRSEIGQRFLEPNQHLADLLGQEIPWSY